MKVAVAIPVLGRTDLLEACLTQVVRTVSDPSTEIIVIDNTPDLDVITTHAGLCGTITKEHGRTRYFAPDHSLGIFDSIRYAADHTDADILAFIHYDVLIWDVGWDLCIAHAFEEDAKLGLAGLVGAFGLAPDGGRIGTHSRLIGQQWGGNGTGEIWRIHGAWTPDDGMASATLDGCGIFYRRNTIPTLLDQDYPGLHHWYDREVCCAWLADGWHIRTLPIRADHGGGAAGSQPAYGDQARAVAEGLGIKDLPAGLLNYDQLMYTLNYNRWRGRWQARLPVTVGADYTTKWKDGGEF